MADMDITREIIVDMVRATNEVAFAEFLYLSGSFLVLYSLSFF